MDPNQIISPGGSSDPVFSTEQTQYSSGKKINPRVTMTGLGQCHMEWDDLVRERPISFEIKESVNTDNNKHTVSNLFQNANLSLRLVLLSQCPNKAEHQLVFLMPVFRLQITFLNS